MSIQEAILEKINNYNVNKTHFKPFKLTFKMQAPIALTHPYLNLDGILAHLLLRRLLGNEYRKLPTNLPLDFFSTLKLPLSRLEFQDLFIYKCSISFFDNEHLFLTTLYKRFDAKHLSRLKTRKKKVERNRGPLKDYVMKLPYRPCQEVHFFGLGDSTEIAGILKGLPGLGKKCAVGHGFINSFNIEELEKDKSLINGEGIAMRPIPCAFLDDSIDYEKVVLAYKFPYWAKQNIAPCCNPGEKIKINSQIKFT